MKILTVGNFSYGWDGSICDEEHIAKALEEAGHQVTRLQREELQDDGREVLGDYDFTLIAQYDGYPADLGLPHPLVYWAFDYQAEGQEWHELLIAQADLYLSKRIDDSKYTNWQWLSQDFAPWFLNRHNEKPPRDIDVLFTGSYLPWATERNNTLKSVDKNFNLVIHSVTPQAWKSEGIKEVYGPIMDIELTSLIARAKINISIDHTIEAGYWSDRNAQIMACGGFVLTRYVPLMETVFKDKVQYFYTEEDCLNKLDYFLHAETADMERKMLGSQGYLYAQNNMMVKHRVRDLLTIVEGIL